MRHPSMIQSKRGIILFLLIYLAVGFCYEMAGEFRLARKYDRRGLCAAVAPVCVLGVAIVMPT